MRDMEQVHSDGIGWTHVGVTTPRLKNVVWPSYKCKIDILKKGNNMKVQNAFFLVK